MNPHEKARCIEQLLERRVAQVRESSLHNDSYKLGMLYAWLSVLLTEEQIEEMKDSLDEYDELLRSQCSTC